MAKLSLTAIHRKRVIDAAIQRLRDYRIQRGQLWMVDVQAEMERIYDAARRKAIRDGKVTA